MIEGFEDITYELTDYELLLVPIFIKGLRGKIGKENAVTSTHIINSLTEYKLTGARVRKIIGYIRDGYLLPGLMASSKGYYISNDIKELEAYSRSLRGRLNMINNILNKNDWRIAELKKLRYEKA